MWFCFGGEAPRLDAISPVAQRDAEPLGLFRAAATRQVIDGDGLTGL